MQRKYKSVNNNIIIVTPVGNSIYRSLKFQVASMRYITKAVGQRRAKLKVE